VHECIGVLIYWRIGVWDVCLSTHPHARITLRAFLTHKHHLKHHHIHVVQADRRVEEAAVRERSRAEEAAEAKWSMALARARQEVCAWVYRCINL
jgi:hypothetical protein